MPVNELKFNLSGQGTRQFKLKKKIKKKERDAAHCFPRDFRRHYREDKTNRRVSAHIFFKKKKEKKKESTMIFRRFDRATLSFALRDFTPSVRGRIMIVNMLRSLRPPGFHDRYRRVERKPL